MDLTAEPVGLLQEVVQKLKVVDFQDETRPSVDATLDDVLRDSG